MARGKKQGLFGRVSSKSGSSFRWTGNQVRSQGQGGGLGGLKARVSGRGTSGNNGGGTTTAVRKTGRGRNTTIRRG